MHLIKIVVPDLEDSQNPQDHLNPPQLLPLQILRDVPQLPQASLVLMEVPPHLENINTKQAGAEAQVKLR